MTGVLHILRRWVVVVAAAVALPAVGFGHAPGPASDQKTLAAFVASGGHIADICGDQGSTDTSPCEACRLSTAVHTASGGEHSLAPFGRAMVRLHIPQMAGDWGAPAKTWYGRAPPA